MKNRFKTNSIRTRIVKVLLVFLIPLIVLLIVYNVYTISVIREEAARSNKNTLSMYAEAVDNRLENISSLLLDIIASNANYNIIRKPNTNLKVYLATYDIVETLTQGLNVHEDADMFFLYSNVNNVMREVYRDSFGSNYNIRERDEIRENLQLLISTNENFVLRGWFPYKIGPKNYLVRIFGKNGTYVGAMIDLEHMVFPLSKMTTKEDYVLLYNTQEGMPLINGEIVSEKKIELLNNTSSYYLSGKPKRYLVLSEDLKTSDINLTALIPDNSILQGLNIIQIILLVTSLMTVFIIPASIYFIRKSVITPLDRLVETINAVKGGDWDTKMDVEFVTDEFRLVNDTLNSMILEIKSLKITAYEEKIDKQKAQLQHLIFQIKPHFFLNALKNIYGMAERKQVEAIQTIILALSAHFRYMFRDNFTLVELKDELNYVKNYLDIQKLSMAEAPICKIDVDERLLSLKIPPISIQTFVENSLKHGLHPERQLKITIKVTFLKTEEGNFADIMVSDNGNGFSHEMMEKLNFTFEQININEHIGLNNVKQRLRLIYGNKAHIAFSVTSSGGAVSEMIIPIENADEEGELK